MDNSQDFKLSRLLDQISIIKGDLEKLNEFNTFVLMCRELTKIFMEMGGILKKAFEDITSKCRLLERNWNMHKHGSLIDFILFEKQKDIAKLNGQNTEKFGYKEGDFYFDYESSARTVLRLMWFFDFICNMTNQLITDQKKSFSSICSEAYNESLAPHHSFTIKTAVKAGLYTVGSRDNFYKVVFKENEDKDEKLALIRDTLMKLKTRLWTLYKIENLDELP
ncbi:unnamed protein product [Paramecium octaurelia]|uniref:Glycolipid transfer protein domain-containing protein n=1 Tax=Paramecium octaurelia TaxID=43137 RepID=A0A8S1Y1R6_PAROT|nr:unnamed protein product [Paramecium octaurelia]